MSKPALASQNKRKTFFYDCITAEFFPFRNVDYDAQLVALANDLREKSGKADGRFTSNYAEIVIYAQDMSFDWKHEDMPQEYYNIETWWNMLVSNTDPVETYLYYRKSIPWEVTNALEQALNAAHTRWKPAHERDDRSKEGETDPNS